MLAQYLEPLDLDELLGPVHDGCEALLRIRRRRMIHGVRSPGKPQRQAYQMAHCIIPTNEYCVPRLRRQETRIGILEFEIRLPHAALLFTAVHCRQPQHLPIKEPNVACLQPSLRDGRCARLRRLKINRQQRIPAKKVVQLSKTADCMQGFAAETAGRQPEPAGGQYLRARTPFIISLVAWGFLR